MVSAWGELEETRSMFNCPGATLVKAIIPLRTAFQPSRLDWFADESERASLSLNNEASRLARCQSLVGWSRAASWGSAAPTQFCHLSASTLADLRYRVCQGVPRWTRPRPPPLKDCRAGKSQASERATDGSLAAKS